MTIGPAAAPRRRVVAIHQPNFFPWLGYFDKIARSDVFVILDHVQFPKTHDSNWSNRVQMMVYGRPAWVTMPLVRTYEGLRRIDQMLIDNGAPWRRKILKGMQDSYGRASGFREVVPMVTELVENPTDRLVDYNLNAITVLSRRLGLRTDHMVRSSELGGAGGKTALLVDIVERVGGTVYLAGGGASGYQDDSLFHAAGIEVQYQRFQHPVYPQRGTNPFVSGLSVLDAIFNCGFEATARLFGAAVRTGAGPSP